MSEAPAGPARLLLALDCDGTLLDPAGAIRPGVRDAVREAAACGALITLATGRRLGAARRYAEALGLRTPLVLHDGAAVQDPFTGAIAYRDPLPPGLVVRLVAAILDHGLHPVACRLTADPSGDTLHVLAGSERDPLMAAYLAARSPVARGDRAALERAAPVVPQVGQRAGHGAQEQGAGLLAVQRREVDAVAVGQGHAAPGPAGGPHRHAGGAEGVEVAVDGALGDLQPGGQVPRRQPAAGLQEQHQGDQPVGPHAPVLPPGLAASPAVSPGGHHAPEIMTQGVRYPVPS